MASESSSARLVHTPWRRAAAHRRRAVARSPGMTATRTPYAAIGSPPAATRRSASSALEPSGSPGCWMAATTAARESNPSSWPAPDHPGARSPLLSAAPTTASQSRRRDTHTSRAFSGRRSARRPHQPSLLLFCPAWAGSQGRPAPMPSVAVPSASCLISMSRGPGMSLWGTSTLGWVGVGSEWAYSALTCGRRKHHLLHVTCCRRWVTPRSVCHRRGWTGEFDPVPASGALPSNFAPRSRQAPGAEPFFCPLPSVAVFVEKTGVPARRL